MVETQSGCQLMSSGDGSFSDFFQNALFAAVIGSLLGVVGAFFMNARLARRKRNEQNYLVTDHLLSELLANEKQFRWYLRRVTKWWIIFENDRHALFDEGSSRKWLRPAPATSRAIFEAAGEKLVDLDPTTGRTVVELYLSLDDADHWHVREEQFEDFAAERAKRYIDATIKMRCAIWELTRSAEAAKKKISSANPYQPPEGVDEKWADPDATRKLLEDMIEGQKIPESEKTGADFLDFLSRDLDTE